MALAMMSWMIAIPLLGFANGLRTMTPIAVLCWFAFLGRLPVEGTWGFWTAKLVSVILFTLFACGEYIGDKLPSTPARTAPGPLAARIVFGGLVGALIATALDGSLIEGTLLGALGAVLGAFVGFHLRHVLVAKTGWPDWPIALAEDALTILASVFALSIVTA